MSRFVFWTGMYDLCLAFGMAVTPVRDALGMHFKDVGPPYILAVLLCYAAATLLISSRSLRNFAPIVYWEGLARIACFPLLIRYGFLGDFGPVAGLLGCADLVIGLSYIIGLKRTCGFSHSDMVLGRKVMTPAIL